MPGSRHIGQHGREERRKSCESSRQCQRHDALGLRRLTTNCDSTGPPIRCRRRSWQHSTDYTYNHIVRSVLFGFIISDKLPQTKERDREAHA
ncbi:hypothetical protein KC332_g13 [Hortaea werneckii]|nr:hypothetical protein KC348_g18 [Hortaea werneckii]KAI7421933.1 hypothetical protein KC332_g13 [Hortaea werneckii]